MSDKPPFDPAVRPTNGTSADLSDSDSNVGMESDYEVAPTLAKVWAETASMLRSAHQREQSAEHKEKELREGVPASELYQRSPFLPKKQWNLVGDLVSAKEKNPCPETNNTYIPGRKWMSLRLDGSGFSKYVKRLRSEGVFPERGFSPEFAEIMQTCAQGLMNRLKGYCVYTQSDEITVLVPPTSLQKLPNDAPEGAVAEHFPHEYNGRVQKLTSQNAAYCASLFNHGLVKFYARSRAEKKKQAGDITEDSVLDFLPPAEFLATFDCRVGSYDTKEEALALLFWRVADCGVNGISDRVHHLKGDTSVLTTLELQKERTVMMGKSVREKIVYLHKLGLFPLKDHQAYGSFYCVVKRLKAGVDPRIGKEQSPTLRRTVEKVEGNVLERWCRDELIPQDDEIEQHETK